MEEQLLSQPKLKYAILAPDEGMWISVLANKRLAREVARAANDWCIDRWLTRRDSRLRSLVVLPNQVPNEAAAEIRRVGVHPGMVGVMMGANGLGLGFGHPVYHPIYEAASELGLPVVLHGSSDASPMTLTRTAAGGNPMTYFEYRTLLWQPVANHVLNLIGEGVFDKFPDLQVLVAGVGAGWLMSWVWSAESKMHIHGSELPWVKQRPTEYVAERIRVTTYPSDVGFGGSPTVLIEAVPDIDRILVFARRSPHL